MNNSEGLKSFQQSLSGLPQWASERILQQINQLTDYEPVIGIMGKTGAGKSSLCNALFAGEVRRSAMWRPAPVNPALSSAGGTAI
jgi:predicted GTPase